MKPRGFVCPPNRGPVPPQNTHTGAIVAEGLTCGCVGLTIMKVLVSWLGLTSFSVPLDLNGFSDTACVPWIQKVHASLGSRGETAVS